MAADDLGERTEEATPRRREQARSEGNIARSQDLAAAIILLGATCTLALAMWPSLGRFKVVIESVLAGDAALGDPADAGQVMALVRHVAAAGILVGAPVLAIMFAVAFVAQFMQVGWLFAPGLLTPRLTRLNPANGLRRILGTTGLVKAGMDLVKVAVVLTVAVLTVIQDRDEIMALAGLASLQILSSVAWMALDLALRLLAALLLLGVLDFTWQRWRHRQDLKMTRQQVKDELKQSEGDPEVKRRRFQMQQRIAMQRISAAVPKADVIVTNPEHVSVAIQYDARRMNAPTVVAKGADFLALRIRQIALMEEIPIVRRPPLARALYKQVAVGQEIPPDFYHAVAEVLAYVYRLSGRQPDRTQGQAAAAGG